MFKNGKGESCLRTKAGKVWFHGSNMHVFRQQISISAVTPDIWNTSVESPARCPGELIFWGTGTCSQGKGQKTIKRNG